MKPCWVVKVGGSMLASADNAEPLMSAIKTLQSKVDIVLVHGGGEIAQTLLQQLGYSSEKLDGIRVTPKEQLPYVVGALAGIANQQLCAQGIAHGLTPVGLSLSDGGMCETLMFDHRFGAVGRAHPRNDKLLRLMLDNDMLPVINSIGADFEGQLLNVNADQAALAICQLLHAELFLLSDVIGVLDEQKTLIPTLDAQSIEVLITKGVIDGGMVVKVQEALTAAKRIEKPVTIASWRDAYSLVDVISDQTFGTQIVPLEGI